MIALNSTRPARSRLTSGSAQGERAALLRGEILLETSSHTAWGGAVTARMYLSATRSRVWQQLTDYPNWVNFFPDLNRSEVLQQGVDVTHADTSPKRYKRLYQAASKSLLIFSARVEVYLRVYEILQQQLQFRLEKGDFLDFSADLQLQDWNNGTLLTYAVRATPSIPIPSLFMQQVMQLGLPDNMRQMRRVLCG